MKRKATNEKSLSHALAKDLTTVCQKYSELTFEDIVKSFETIERTHLAQASDNEFLALETRRRVAEHLVFAAIYKRRPWEEARGLLDNLVRLGFTNIEVKVLVLQSYSKYCLKIGRNNEGIALLALLETQLENELGRKDFNTPARRYYSDELESTRALLNKLRGVSMSEGRWKFLVEGTFLKDGSPVSPCEAIIESGDRFDGSPFRLWGAGPIAKADASGRFQSWYLTEGSHSTIEGPQTVSVYVRVAAGDWEPLAISVDQNAAVVLSDNEMKLDLGVVTIPSGMTPYAQ
jgi:hypothetical protein